MVKQEPWASVNDVARNLRIATDTLYRWIKSKVLSTHKIVQLWKFTLTEIDTWVCAVGPDVQEAEGSLKTKGNR
jgi:excisionase family DNA binding protein